MKDHPLELDQLEISLIMIGVRLVRDCGLLDEDQDEHAKKLLDKLGNFVEEEDDE